MSALALVPPPAPTSDAAQALRPLSQPHPFFLVVVEARPIVQVIYVLRFVVGYALASADQLLSSATLEGATSWWLAVVAVYAFNGITDYAEDSANGSTRPVARGALGRTTAGIACALASGGSMALAFLVPAMLPWVGAYLLLGWLYSAPPVPAKNRTASAGAVVFGLGWCSYAAGAAASGRPMHAAELVFVAAASAWMAIVGTVVKDLSDVEGDAAGGRRTLAVRFGRRTAGLVGACGALGVGVGACIAAILSAPSSLAGTIPFALGSCLLCASIAVTASVKASDRWGQRTAYRVFMRTQYTANVFVLAEALMPI